MERIPIEDLSVGEAFHFPETNGFEGEWTVDRFDSLGNTLYAVRTRDEAEIRVSLDVGDFAFVYKDEQRGRG